MLIQMSLINTKLCPYIWVLVLILFPTSLDCFPGKIVMLITEKVGKHFKKGDKKLNPV